jgi:hypothetical protein
MLPVGRMLPAGNMPFLTLDSIPFTGREAAF